MKKHLFLFIFIFSSILTFSYQLRGVILDSESQPLPYVTVVVKNTTYAVSSNLNGQYFMELEDGEHTVLYSYLGYKTIEKQVSIKGSNISLDVQMLESETELSEIEVKISKRDYAFEIISKAIKARDQNRNQFHNYTCNAYVKASLEKESIKLKKDTIIGKEKMDFVESYSELSYQKPNKYKETKKGYRDFSQKFETDVSVTFNFEDDAYTSKPSVINQNLFKINLDQARFDFYDNLMNIPSLGEVPFTSPISATSFLSYKFKYIDSFEEKGLLINKIQVIPRVKEGALFSGYIYIVEDSWVIKAVEFELPSTMLIYYNYFKIFQEYEQVEGKWVLTREEFFYNRKFTGNHLLGNTVIKYQNYKLDNVFPKRYFSNEIRVIEDDAMEKDSLYWEEVRPLTLKDEERSFIHQQDSIIKYESTEEFMRKEDSTVNHINFWSIVGNGVYHQNSFKKREYYFNSLLNSVDPFGVGGYRQSLGGGASQGLENGKKVDANYRLNYGFNNQDLKGDIELGYQYNLKKLTRVYAGYENNFDAINKYESISNSFSRQNFVQLRSWHAGHEIEVVNGFFIDAFAEYAQRKSIAGFQLSDWSQQLFGENNIPVNFDDYDQLLFDFTFSFRFDQKYAMEPNRKIIIGSKYPKVDINYKKAIPGVFNASLDFDFLELRVFDDIKMGAMGVSKFKLFAGRFLRGDSIMFTDHKFFRGSDPVLFSSPLRSFQLLGNSFNTKNEYFQLHYLHNFNGTLLNKIPVLNKLGLRTVAGISTLLIEDVSFSHGEAFLGLELPFRLGKQVFKIGAYYVGADSNYSALTSTFKIGIDMFNPYTNSWSY